MFVVGRSLLAWGDTASSLPFTNLMGGPRLKQQFASSTHLCACSYVYTYVMVCRCTLDVM